MFQDSYVLSIYVIYKHFMNIICTFHIFMYEYVTVSPILEQIYLNHIWDPNRNYYFGSFPFLLGAAVVALGVLGFSF